MTIGMDERKCVSARQKKKEIKKEYKYNVCAFRGEKKKTNWKLAYQPKYWS